MLAFAYCLFLLKLRSSWFLEWWLIFYERVDIFGIMLQDWESYLNLVFLQSCYDISPWGGGGWGRPPTFHWQVGLRDHILQLIFTDLWWAASHFCWQSGEFRLLTLPLWTPKWELDGNSLPLCCWKSQLSTRLSGHCPSEVWMESRLPAWFPLIFPLEGHCCGICYFLPRMKSQLPTQSSQTPPRQCGWITHYNLSRLKFRCPSRHLGFFFSLNIFSNVEELLSKSYLFC